MSYTGGGKFSEIYARSRRPSFLEMVQAAGLTKQQRDARAADEERAAREQESLDFNHERLVAADNRAAAEGQAAAQIEADKRKANKERYFAQLLQSRPGDADRISQAARAQGIELGTMTTPDVMRQARAANVEIEDATTPSEAADMLQGRASGVLGAPDLAKQPRDPTTNEITEYERAQRDPQFAAWLKDQERQKLARASAVGGKALPTNTVEGMADSTSAGAAIDDLLASFSKDVPSEGLIDQTGARIASKIANTDTSIYQSKANIATQTVGTYLEGGVLKEADFDRYRQMMPQPGDSRETAKAKADNLKKAIQMRANERVRQLGGAGYRVPGGDAQPKPDKSAAISRLNALASDYAAKNPDATPDQVREAAAAQYRVKQQQGAQ